jgi:hypothetical protein
VQCAKIKKKFFVHIGKKGDFFFKDRHIAGEENIDLYLCYYGSSKETST